MIFWDYFTIIYIISVLMWLVPMINDYHYISRQKVLFYRPSITDLEGLKSELKNKHVILMVVFMVVPILNTILVILMFFEDIIPNIIWPKIKSFWNKEVFTNETD